MLEAGVVAYFLGYLVIAIWYGRANTRWASTLDERGAFFPGSDTLSRKELSAQPVQFFLTLPGRVRQGVHLLSRPDEVPESEFWRLRTVRRAIVAVTYMIYGSVIPLGVLVIVWTVPRLTERFGPAAWVLLGVEGAILLAAAISLIRLVARFGNGGTVATRAIAVSAAGVVTGLAVIGLQGLLIP